MSIEALSDSNPKMVKVDLTELQDEGILFHANEQFFWPLGLALTWEVSTVAVDKTNWCRDHSVHGRHDVTAYSDSSFEGRCEGTQLGNRIRNLHVTQWEWPDGHIETIEDDGGDPTPERRARFLRWIEARMLALPTDEVGPAVDIYSAAVKQAAR